MNVRVLLVDDEVLVRTGLRAILESEPDLEVVGEANDESSAVAAARALAPDVVLMDIHMRGSNGLEAAARILRDQPGLRVVMLTTFDLDDYVEEALRIGVSGFLLKDAPREQLTTAVRIAAAGDAMLDPGVTRRVIAHFATKVSATRTHEIERLTAREIDVMRLVARGLSNGEISAELFISETTVKTHISNILMKLHLRDRTQIAVAAFESGVAR